MPQKKQNKPKILSIKKEKPIKMPKKKSIKKSKEASKKQTVTSLVGWELDSFPTIYNNETKKQKSI